MIAANELVDNNLYGAQGQQIGTVNEVVMDRSGQSYVVVGRGGFLGLGENQFIVPMNQLQLRSGNLYAPQLSQQQLQSMPRYRMGDQNYTVVQAQQQVQVPQAQ